ncbi:hypothetical protein [Nocardioides bruguierae]|uniref:hypothetical protein n=1 Tax=Nocardioides bruguierae TaxID=2945102 RepID=UPI00202FCAF6|nr:hypothetical protein [Nocardioides bruguierae]
MPEPTAETDWKHLMVSRRGIVYLTQSLADDAATACGKGSRDLVYIGAVGLGERMCHTCATGRGSEADRG